MDDEQVQCLEKFIDSVRREIKENKVNLVATKNDLDKFEHKDIKSKVRGDLRYGIVEKEVFLKILNRYEEMQKDNSTMNHPVKCDKVFGESLSNYLHSRPGFHNLGSTTLLMQELNIKDPNRYSFLGGLSNLEPPSDERLSKLKQLAKRAEVCKYLVQARQLLNLGQPKEVQAMIDRCTKLDPDNPEIHAIIGSLQLAKGQITEAISTLRAAIDKRGIRDPDRIRKDLSDAHSKQGYKMSCKRSWAEAIHHYEEAIRWDPSNEFASHQLSYCRIMYHNSRTCSWGKPAQNYERRK